ncbi:MAG: DUF3048 domain-containing protein [Bacilli bacterium]|nr:DUF3048 domain-containing protein [Bacilli bacterium]
MKKLFLKIKNMKKSKKIIMFIICVLIITAVIFACTIFFKPETIKEIKKKLEPKNEQTVKKISIFNMESKTRPIAVMINNHNQARPYHSGLDKAQIVYEFIVEGGITRMLAIFKDQDVSRIGPVRSSRHYYLDYALENDAIYVHWGWSPQAESDIRSLGVNNLNGLYDYGFSRDQNLIGKINLEHTAITSTDGIKEAVKRKAYRTEYKTDNVEDNLVLKYSANEINLGKDSVILNLNDGSGLSLTSTSFIKSYVEGINAGIPVQSDSKVANKVVIPYSNYMTVSYIYDSDNKYYLRYANNSVHKDYITGEQYHFKNILILKVENHTMDSYGRQDLKNVGTGKGYYITNGYAKEITWHKDSRANKTKYKYLDGSEVIVNDGNTFIQVEPIGMNPTISE